MMNEILSNDVLSIIIIIGLAYIIIKVSNKILKKISGIVFTIYTILKIATMCGVDISKVFFK